MEHDDSQKDSERRLRRAGEKVLADESFARSPVTSRLLEYLIERTLEGVPLKSYTIAIDALGKSEADMSDADTYARVAVARLRKALASYYSVHPEEDEIYVDVGSYQVRLKCAEPPVEAAKAPMARKVAAWQQFARHAQANYMRYLAVVFAFLALATVAYVFDVRHKQERWLTSDFPSVAIVHTSPADGNGRQIKQRREFTNELAERLFNYVGLRLVEGGEIQADFELQVSLDSSVERTVYTTSLVEIASRRIIWTRQYTVADAADLADATTAAAAEIAAPSGALDDAGRKRQIDSNTPYGCWLRFTGSTMSYTFGSDRELHQCAQEWHSADPTNRTAAFLRAWTLTDASTTVLSESARRAQLEEALAVAHQALARNPDGAMLYLAEMRIYSFLGDPAKVRASAASAIANAPANRVVQGMAATWLAFWNDPMGGKMLRTLETNERVSFPWEHAGHVVDAMMRDDVRLAGEHLIDLRFYLKGQPALRLLEAAYAGRTGDRRSVEKALDQLRTGPRAMVVGIDDILERMPLAPEVRARFVEWINYDPSSI